MNVLCALGFHKWRYRPKNPQDLRTYPFMLAILECRRCGRGK